jgi:hypothetical protein
MKKWISIVYCYNKGIIILLTKLSEAYVCVGKQVKFAIASSRSVVPKSERKERIKIWEHFILWLIELQRSLLLRSFFSRGN